MPDQPDRPEQPDQPMFPASLKPVPGTFQWKLIGFSGDPAEEIPLLAEPWELELRQNFSRYARFCMTSARLVAHRRGHPVLTPSHLLLGLCESKLWDLHLLPAGPSSSLIAPALESLLEQESSALQQQWLQDPTLQQALAHAREEAHERGYPIVGIETFLVPDASLQRIFALAKDEARQHGAQRVSLGPLLLGLLRAVEEDLLPPSLQQLLARFGLSYAAVRSSLSDETFSL